MKNKKERICWDSCICIATLQEHSKTLAFIDPISRLARKGNLAIVASAMAIVETLDLKNVHPVDEICLIQEFFRESVHLQIMDRPVAQEA